MTLITVRETTSPQAVVSFDRRGEYPITIQDPFDDNQEKELEWFFEKYLRWPFLQEHRANAARKGIQVYGETLFRQVFESHPQVLREYGRIISHGASSLQFEIIGSPAFHRWHWEALKDPDRPLPFALEAPMVRSTFTPSVVTPTLQPSPTINLLVVTARPRGRQDVGYRTITRPLVEGLRQAQLPVQVEIVRPGSYRALLEHLEQSRQVHGVGHYHLIHFDLHGALLRYQEWEQADIADHLLFRQGRFGRGDIIPYDGVKAFLAFEKETGEGSDLAEAGELANLLLQHHIPIAVLNACQSGKQVGSSETSLGSRLLQAGVQTVVAMSYSVTVSAAVLMMKQLYSQLFAHNNLAQAIRLGRAALSHQKERQAVYDQQIELEDWLLPVVYQLGGAGATANLPLRPFTAEEQVAYWAAQTGHYQPNEPTYGFVGRDVDILHIEKRLLTQSEGKRRNLLLIRGLGGAGKTTLLRHLGSWWQKTGLVQTVFYFGYDERAWVLPQLLDAIAQKLYGGDNTLSYRAFQLLPPAAQATQLGQKLRGNGICSSWIIWNR